MLAHLAELLTNDNWKLLGYACFGWIVLVISVETLLFRVLPAKIVTSLSKKLLK